MRVSCEETCSELLVGGRIFHNPELLVVHRVTTPKPPSESERRAAQSESVFKGTSLELLQPGFSFVYSKCSVFAMPALKQEPTWVFCPRSILGLCGGKEVCGLGFAIGGLLGYEGTAEIATVSAVFRFPA